MIFALLVTALIALVAVVIGVRREREVRKLAHFLRDYPHDSNASIVLETRSTGILELAHAADDKLDEIQQERIHTIRRELELQQTLSALSHDIRTPLAAAQGYLQLLGDEDDYATRQRYRTMVEKRLFDVRQLLDELLLYAKTQDSAWHPAKEPVNVGDILAETLAAFYLQFKEKDWVPQVEISQNPLLAATDHEALARIFRNLVTNTLQHGAAAPSITLYGKTIVFSNQVFPDSAIDIEHLYDRFYQGDASRTSGGTGLGLAIVVELSRALNIALDTSLINNTLTITLTLP
ncbi:MAG: HAMP domain-containing sensor histidine kinase [Raoultibacter sp.]